MHSSSSTAFVPTSARKSSLSETGSSVPSVFQGSISTDGKRFRPEPLAMMMPTGLEGEAFGFVKDVITAGMTGGTGDVIAQFAAEKKNDAEGSELDLFPEPFELDVRRSLSYAAFAAGYTGAFQHVLFSNLHDAIPDPVVRLAINQGLIIPLCYYSLLVWLVPKLRARTAAEEETLRSSINVMSMIPRNWAFWVPLQFIQFNYIPTEFQVIYCSVLGLVWNICLSFFTAGTTKTEQPPVLPETALLKSDVQITITSPSGEGTGQLAAGLPRAFQSEDSFKKRSERRGAKWLRILNGSEDEQESAPVFSAVPDQTTKDSTAQAENFSDTISRRRP